MGLFVIRIDLQSFAKAFFRFFIPVQTSEH